MKTLSEIQDYYDSTVDSRIAEFVNSNPRIEAAWAVVRQWANSCPANILEIGCGIGDISWRMSLYWPEAKITGLDVSPKELATAQTLFGSERVTFVKGPLTDTVFTQTFDLVVLMDVYEHILPKDREVLHRALKQLLSGDGRVVLSFPTPRHQAWLRQHDPRLIQPVDEDISPEIILALAQDINRDLLFYCDGGVWHKGDYAYAVLGNRQGWIDVNSLSFFRKIRTFTGNLLKSISGKKHLIKEKVKFTRFKLPSRSQRAALVRAKLRQQDSNKKRNKIVE